MKKIVATLVIFGIIITAIFSYSTVSIKILKDKVDDLTDRAQGIEKIRCSNCGHECEFGPFWYDNTGHRFYKNATSAAKSQLVYCRFHCENCDSYYVIYMDKDSHIINNYYQE